ncbi:glycoside hydrolase, partial [Aureobasidium melanogenum]
MLSKTLLSSALAALSLLPSTSVAAPLEQFNKRDLKFNYGGEKVRGVNLGGWFVLEPWITPSIFEATPDNVVDEYTYCQTLGSSEAYSRLSNHWNTWITEDDFHQIAAAGMNHVRIPIGYWSVIKDDNAPYVQGAYEFLGRALDWAAGAGLKVMIDLHGAPYSQNGFDNSGRRGGIGWGQGDSVTRTKDALNKIRDDMGNHSAVSTIELLNEPMGSSIGMDTVRQFYMDGWGNLRDTNLVVTFHDAFAGVNSWNDWGSGMWNLMLDTHHYEVFDSGVLKNDIGTHISTACAFGASMATNNKWTISGEWTGAMSDCTKWLNGRGVGARYDGTYNYNGQSSSYIGSCDGKYTGTVAGLDATYRDNIGKFIEAQLDGYEKAAGWIFWTWKTESSPEWDMQELLQNGVFPNPVTNRNHPGQCN